MWGLISCFGFVHRIRPKPRRFNSFLGHSLLQIAFMVLLYDLDQGHEPGRMRESTEHFCGAAPATIQLIHLVGSFLPICTAASSCVTGEFCSNPFLVTAKRKLVSGFLSFFCEYRMNFLFFCNGYTISNESLVCKRGHQLIKSIYF